MQEFLKECRVAQEQISSNIPWATFHAEQRQSGQHGESEEERLLADLLVANGELLDVLKMYDDLENQEKRDREKAEHKLRALEAITSFAPTPAESVLVDRIFSLADPQNSGSIRPDAAHHIFMGTNLPHGTLQTIWDIANVEENPMYGKYCVGIAVRLVGHVQNGAELDEELITRAGPVALITGLDEAQSPNHSGIVRSGTFTASSSRPPLPHALSDLPPLTEQDRQKFLTIFNRSGPENSALNGVRAREVLMKSRLPTDVLGQIWDLADIQSRGYLDAPAFTVAMYLVQACMSGQLNTIPPVLPQSVYEQAALSAPHAVLDAHYGTPGPSTNRGSPSSARVSSPSMAAAPEANTSTESSLIDLSEEVEGLQPPLTMPIPSIAGTPLDSVTIPPPGLSMPRSPLSPSVSTIFRLPPIPSSTSGAVSVFQATSDVIPEGWNWDVSPADKAGSDKFFETLDPWKQGFVEGDAAVTFLSKSKLSPAVLAHVWDLADINCDGKLTKEEFAVAMYLIRGKLAGKEIPDQLPPSLIPPPDLPEVILAPTTPPQTHTAPATPAVTAHEPARSGTPPPAYEESLDALEDTV